jgi:DUF4097 and DUF4098 domain-containing protein YvlB
MHRITLLITAAMLLAAPAPGSAQSTAERERERARERAAEVQERARERAEEQRERDRERAEEQRERDRERAEEQRERAAERVERDRERRERDAAGVLDTVVAFDARGAVTVSCPGGDIIVTASDRNELRVKARTERGAIRFSSSNGRASIEPATSHGCGDGRFEIVVPANAAVTATSWHGSISVRGVHGDLEAHAQSGDIDVRDAGDRVELQTLSGSISLLGARGDATIHTLSGDVKLDGARGEVEVETVSGDMQLGDIVSKQVRTHSTSGDLTFAGAISDGGRYEFTTHSGELRLRLPAAVGAQLTVSTFSGGIESEFPITLKAGEHGIGVSQAKKINFTLGQGSARIVAETFSGDVILTSSAARRP